MGGFMGAGAVDASSPYGNGAGKGGPKGGKPGTFFTLYGCIKKAGILGGKGVPQENMLYVKNLPEDTTDCDLYKLCSPFGAIAPSGVRAMTNPDGTCKGFGFVDFADAQCANLAVQTLNGFQMPDGSFIGVSVKKASKGMGKGEQKGNGMAGAGDMSGFP